MYFSFVCYGLLEVTIFKFYCDFVVPIVAAPNASPITLLIQPINEWLGGDDGRNLRHIGCTMSTIDTVATELMPEEIVLKI